MSKYLHVNLIPIKTLQKISSERIYKHIKKVKRYKASFICDCCCLFEWDIHPRENDTRAAEYNALKEYLQSAWDVINARGDLKEVKNKNRIKHELKKAKGEKGGHQKKSHSKRKK